MANRKVMYLKQIADAYGVDYRTFKKDMERKEVFEELTESGWDGLKFYTREQEIVEKHFGPMPDKK
jgi:hypothetical protein